MKIYQFLRLLLYPNWPLPSPRTVELRASLLRQRKPNKRPALRAVRRETGLIKTYSCS